MRAAVSDLLTLRPGIKPVNTATQYVVDFEATTQDVAPALRQKRTKPLMTEVSAVNRRAVEILAEFPAGIEAFSSGKRTLPAASNCLTETTHRQALIQHSVPAVMYAAATFPTEEVL